MPQPKPLPPVELLREIFDYNPETGDLTFLIYNNRHRKGDTLTRRTSKGYLCWTFERQHYYAHRIAWKIHTGKEPPEVVDHRNRQRDDNSWRNLRASDNTSNRYNMTPWGKRFLPGVGQRRPGGNYYAKLTAGKKQIYLGTFQTEEEAHAVYCDAHRQHFGKNSIYAAEPSS